ncbi:MAG: MFS transporter [Candidatus Levybacteria bacterium]|nr:MFS transporter [Candidatus Levybacteria bacterium]
MHTKAILVQRFSRYFGIKKAFSIAIGAAVVAFLIMFFSRSLAIFIVAAVIMGVFNGFVQTLITTIISQETDAKSQGTIMGLNASYMSVGQILGPIVGGAIATIFIPLPLLAGAISAFFCLLLSFKVLKPGVKKESAF